jgi:hypothetical protein
LIKRCAHVTVQNFLYTELHSDMFWWWPPPSWGKSTSTNQNTAIVVMTVTPVCCASHAKGYLGDMSNLAQVSSIFSQLTYFLCILLLFKIEMVAVNLFTHLYIVFCVKIWYICKCYLISIKMTLLISNNILVYHTYSCTVTAGELHECWSLSSRQCGNEPANGFYV